MFYQDLYFLNYNIIKWKSESFNLLKLKIISVKWIDNFPV